MDVVRITELQPKTYVEQGDYIAIDNQSDGTKKVQFTNLLDDTLSQENKIAPANVVGNEIATIKAAVGSPLKASTVAQMTDTNKIYVYVGSESGYTNGNWYYWNGSAWTSGGVYNSVAVVTDPTLTLSGMPADAKATGDKVINLKSDLTNRIITAESNIGTLETHKVAQPLDEYNQPINGTSGQSLRTKGDGTTEWADVGLPTDEQTAQAISDWLDEHPEATTTVQDDSLTLPKFKTGELPFVTPEQFGAKGDGVIDDTVAWQTAVDSGYNVKATKKNYKCGKINVTKNITIDCNDANFLSVENVLFNCEGEVVTTLLNEADYVANQSRYILTDTNYSNYSGFAMLKGTNNFELARTYYIGGFVCEFLNGAMSNSYPIDVVDVEVEIINPIIVNLKNIGNINHLNGGLSTESITIKYGQNCVIENSSVNDSGGFTLIKFDSCMCCKIVNCDIKYKYPENTSMTYNYAVALLNSSFCCVKDTKIYNVDWHCITTGDKYLCYHNVIDNCILMSDGNYAYCDHENALNTIVINTISAGIMVSAMGVVENCIITSQNISYKNCLLRFAASSIRENAVYHARNIKFVPDISANSSYVGVQFASSPQTTGNQYYYKEAVFENIIIDNAVSGMWQFILPNTSNFKFENITINNTNFNIRLGKLSSESSIDISDYKLVIENCHIKNDKINQFPTIGYTNYIFNTVVLNNVDVNDVIGTFETLILNNYKATQTLLTTINKLYGNGVHSRIHLSVFPNCSDVHVTDMLYSSGVTFMNISKSDDNNVYYQRWIGNAITTYKVAT